jgi:predicted anti-sigma-YlaC factor YlaD
MKFLLKCGETAEVCDKCQYEEASLFEKIRMKLHLIMCKCCRNYSANNNKLTNSIKTADIKTFSTKEKEFLKAKLEQEMRTKSKS